MLHQLFPRIYRTYEDSRLAGEFEEFAAWLRESGYSDYLICRYLCRLRKALEPTRAVIGKQWSISCLNGVFERHCKSTVKQRTVEYRATRRAYERYLDARGRLRKVSPTAGPFGSLRPEYQQYLREVRGFCPGTSEHHLATISEFLSSALKSGESLAHLTSMHVESYLAAKSRTRGRHSLQHAVAHLRAFLRYAFARALIRERLDTIDTPRTYRGELPPRALPWPLVQRLLSSIDRSSRAGWRNYTMLHLMAYYGLRPSEVAALRIDCIDWNTKTCLVEQRKTHCDLVLPLLDRTVALLRRYVRRERPHTTHPQLFLRVRNPAGRIRHTAVCGVFYKEARRSGLPLQQYSSYSLRHAFAMRLLQRGVGVKAIGDLLGHHSLEATCVYLRLNVVALRTVGLPLPRVKYV